MVQSGNTQEEHWTVFHSQGQTMKQLVPTELYYTYSKSPRAPICLTMWKFKNDKEVTK